MIRKESVKTLIDELNLTDETNSLEAKRSSEVGRSLLETINSLSNEPGLGGGTILLGVEKEELSLFPSFQAAGVDEVDKLTTEIATQCATTFNLPIRPTITQELVNRKVVIRVDVPELKAFQKPLYFSSVGLPKGAYRRIASSDIKFTPDDLYAVMSGRASEPYDTQVIADADWNDVDPDAVSAYRRFRAEANSLAEELNLLDEDLLIALRCAVRIADVTKITVAGLITFGKSASLRRLRPTHRIEYIRVPGKKWVSDPDNRYVSVEIRGPLILSIGRIITSILDDIPKAFKLQDNNLQRDDIPLVPEKVIREAVVNAVAHRNYEKNTAIQILRYSNRLEIRNPGCSLKSDEQFDEPGSMLRNPNIAEVLHETRFAETKGTGIRVMRQRMTEMGLAQPAFVSSRENDQFAATFLFHHFLNEADWKWLSAFTPLGLDNDQLRALIFVREMGAIDNSCFRNLCETDMLAASSSLRKLKEFGLIDARGTGSGTYYVPSPLLEAEAQVPAKVVSGVSQEAVSGDVSGDVSGGIPIDGLSTDKDRRDGNERELSINLKLRISLLQKRMQRNEAEAVILEICKARPFSAEEIAKLLGRNGEYIRKRYLLPMMIDGRLSYTIPDMIKHPDQKYTAVRKISRV